MALIRSSIAGGAANLDDMQVAALAHTIDHINTIAVGDYFLATHAQSSAPTYTGATILSSFYDSGVSQMYVFAKATATTVASSSNFVNVIGVALA